MEYVWTAPGTDITIRWRLNGWVPPSEQQVYRDKWRYYQELPMRTLDAAGREKYEETLRQAKVARIK